MTGNIAKLYDRNVIKFRELVSEIKKNVKKGDVAIDLGCGTGAYLGELEKAVGKKGKVIATDNSSGMVVFCRKKFQRAEVKKLAAEKLSDIKVKADVVFASLVLQFTKAEKAVAEIRKTLKPSGKLIFAVPLYRTGITAGVDRQSRKFKTEFRKNLKEELERIGVKEKPSLEYPNERSVLFRKLLQKNRFIISRWSILPMEKNTLKQLLEYYRVPWRSAKILNRSFKVRYRIITGALEKTFAKYPEFEVQRYYLIAVATKK